MEKRQGALYFDREEERYNIRFGLEECYHGLVLRGRAGGAGRKKMGAYPD